MKLLIRECDKGDSIDFPNGMKLTIDYGNISKLTKKYQKDKKSHIWFHPYQRTRLFDKNGDLIAEIVEENPDKLSDEYISVMGWKY